MHVRPFAESDLFEAARIYTECFNEPPWNDGWTGEAALERLSEIFERSGFLGGSVEVGGSLVGFVLGHTERWVSGPHYYLNELCVEAEYRNKGVGRLLMDTLLERLYKLGVEGVYLMTERASPAESFFRALGFEEDVGAIKMWRVPTAVLHPR